MGQINFLGARVLHGTDVRWLGTYAGDQIPPLEHERRPIAPVINSDVPAGPFEHCLVLDEPRGSSKIEMFDSLGLPPDLYSLDQSLIQFSTCSIQALNTKVCGHYALLFIYLSSRGYSFNNSIINLEKNFTDALAACQILDL